MVTMSPSLTACRDRALPDRGVRAVGIAEYDE